jgi:hypothetical protein
LDEVEIPDIDLTNYDNASLGFILNEQVEKPKFRVRFSWSSQVSNLLYHLNAIEFLSNTFIDQ